MNTQPAIFTVYVFQIVVGKRRLRTHFVAGTSSADAEARIKASNATHLAGQCFITTDEHERVQGDGCKLYTTETDASEPINDDAYRLWVRAMTNPSWDADRTPAPLRRFHVDGNRAALAAEADRYATL
jgi:hypothetical protein